MDDTISVGGIGNGRVDNGYQHATITSPGMSDPATVYEAIYDEIDEVLIGNEDIVEGLTVSLLTRGHVLLEGVPGVAKTTIANLFARATGLEFNRIQMTPDILPADITGTYVYREQTGTFDFQRGPVFANLVVADEINRATPKTQSALLEAMQERTVTVEGETHTLPEPFFVVATQNPIEMEGSLHPDESFYLNDSLWKASDAVEHAKTTGELIHETEDTRIFDGDFRTQTLTEDGTLQDTECYLYEKEYSGRLCRIQTKTGRSISVSDNHPFLVNRRGTIQWIEAGDIREGDHLVSPDGLTVESREFPTHEAALDALEEEYHVVRQSEVSALCDLLTAGEPLSREQLDALRIASGWSKKDLAERISATYDQVLNYFSGSETSIGGQIREAIEAASVEAGDYIESHKIHRFGDPMTDEQAGFFTGFILSDGHLGDTEVSITQKNLSSAFDRWVDVAEQFGMDVRTGEKKGSKYAAVGSRPFVDYLRYRYDIGSPSDLLNAPEAFRRSFLEIFLLAESHYDVETQRISFVQKDRETTNLIAHLLLQFDIRPWIKKRETKYEIRIQGRDIRTYLETFEWRGANPEVDSFGGRQRTVPLPEDSVERVVELLGVQFEGGMSDEEWYNAYTHARDGGPSTEHLAEMFIDSMRHRIDRKQQQYGSVQQKAQDDLEHAAKACGLSLTDIVEGTELTKYRVWQVYEGAQPPEEAVKFVTERFTERVEAADDLTSHLESLVGGDVFYDPVTEIESEPYEGPVIGLSVPQTHNYLAGLGACGINHNTFELPEAQRDRFQFKLTVDLPTRDMERELWQRFDSDPGLGPERTERVVAPEEILEAREHVRDVYVDESVREYVLDIVEATRTSGDVAYGASPRATLAFLNAGKARAAVRGRSYVIPDDVKALAEPVLAHRLVLSTDAELSDLTPAEVIEGILDTVTAPGGETELHGEGSPAVSDGGGEQGEGRRDGDPEAEAGEERQN
jgi:MoxR-like ATPase